MKIPKLDLWLALDKDFVGHKTFKENLFIYDEEPIKRVVVNSVFFISRGNERNFGKLFSASGLNLSGDYNAYKLYVLEQRYKKNIRTFWLFEIGYNKYVITDRFIKKGNIYEYILDDALLFIDNFKCSSDVYFNLNKNCKNCPKYKYCTKIAKKHQFRFKKIYFYFYKNNKKVYL